MQFYNKIYVFKMLILCQEKLDSILSPSAQSRCAFLKILLKCHYAIGNNNTIPYYGYVYTNIALLLYCLLLLLQLLPVIIFFIVSSIIVNGFVSCLFPVCFYVYLLLAIGDQRSRGQLTVLPL